MNYFADLYASGELANRKLGELCTNSMQCVDVNAECVRFKCLSQTQCSKSGVKICQCKTNYFQTIDLRDNNFICGKISI